MPNTLSAAFIPDPFAPADWEQVAPLIDQLLARDLSTLDALERWLTDFSELSAALSEYGSRCRINYACHTDDPEIEKAFLFYVENIAPKIQPACFELQKKYLASPARVQLPQARFAVLDREWQASVDLFRQENVPLKTQITKAISSYDKLIGAMTVEFQGKTHTLQQLARFQEEPDRAVREQSWTLSANRRLQDKDAIEQQFDELLKLRQQLATNAGKANYRDYVWQDFCRFDYTPDDCLAFADAIAEVCVPLVRKLDAKRKADLGLDKLQPWDLAVDPKGRQPLRPFEPEDTDKLVAGTRDIFAKLSPSLAADFAKLKDGRNLDLQSRQGKRAGGFQSSLEQSQEPFIFMNAAGLQRDVETLLHEGGHAFHFIWACQQEPLVFLRHAPLEFCEVASMAMELMGSHHFDVFYPSEEDRTRARQNLLEGIVRFFPWMATIDTFQHWLYTHPEHTPDERKAQWLAIRQRFGSDVVDWTGYEDALAYMWHRQLHLFHHPFYYIEYGIAQLGALQMWAQFRSDREQALAAYRKALSLGGTQPLPELFNQAGLRFDFTRETFEPAMQALWAQLEEEAD